MTLIFTLFCLILAISYFFVRKTLNYWNDKKVLHVKPKFPWGNFNFRQRNIAMIELVKEIYDKFYGKDLFCGFYFTLSPRILLLDSEMIKNVLIKDFQYFHDRGLYTNEGDDPLSYHLFAMEGELSLNVHKNSLPTLII
jgi:cytochrome P450 family 6